jgi:hypothetical protein
MTDQYWDCYIGGKPGLGSFAIVLPEGMQPNRFHRWMQYWVIGFRWKKHSTKPYQVIADDLTITRRSQL